MIEFHVMFGNREDAEAAGRAALEARLAACVNILDGVTSLYWWDDAIERETEAIAILKTSDDRADALEAFMAQNHPYDTPAIIRHANVSANASYARWVEEETRSPS